MSESERPGIDVFLSYQHASRPEADAIVSHLESHQVRCWYAPRNVRGGYAGSIMNAISSCRAFVLLLDQRSSESPQVLNEVEAAYGRVMEAGLPIIPVRLDDRELNAEMLYYVKRLHWVDAFSQGLDKALEDLTTRIFELAPDRKAAYERTLPRGGDAADRRGVYGSRTGLGTEIFGEVAADEGRRRRMQHLVLREFDQPVYDRLINGREGLSVIDVGCDDGEALHNRFGYRPEVAHILGIDSNEALLAKARATYCEDGRYAFAQCDIESPALETVLADYLASRGLRGFDFVNITMVIMDLEKPYAVLRTIRRFMNEGGTIFIRDIDDGLNVAYPDEDGGFRRLNELSAALPTTGFRKSGRQVFSLLKRAGYRDIVLERSGLSTVGMDHDRRNALFTTCFGWLRRGLRERLEVEPTSARYLEDLEWLEESLDNLEESFQDPSFFYQEGFMIYSARSYKGQL